MSHTLRREMSLPRPLASVFAFFADAQNLERITPPELRFRILSPGAIEMACGTRIDYRLRLYGLPLRWRAKIARWDPPHLFVDEQERGPYAKWIHEHRFEARGPHTWMVDQVDYALPLTPWSKGVLPLVRLQLDRIFDYRARTVARLLAERGR